MDTHFKLIDHGSSDWKLAVALREEILRKPLGSFFTDEELEEEEQHFQIAGFSNEKLIATAVLVPEGNTFKMQRVAVDESQRNTGIGSRMMEFCETFARENNVNKIYCHARYTAVQFYLNNGYSPDGDYFDEDGIPHLKMYKEL